MKRLTILAASLVVLAGSALAKECRMPDPKLGVRLHVPPECDDEVRSKPQRNEALKSEPGAIDLGSGTTLRIGGRVRAETSWRH